MPYPPSTYCGDFFILLPKNIIMTFLELYINLFFCAYLKYIKYTKYINIYNSFNRIKIT